MPNARSTRRTRRTPADRRAPLRGAIAKVVQGTILAAAERVVAQKGVDATRMADIAAEAGIGTGSLYTYFDSKDEIFAALLRERGEEMLKQLAAVAPSPPRERMVRLVETSLSHLERHRTLFLMLMEAGAAPGFAAPRNCPPAILDLQKRIRDLWRAQLVQAVADGAVRRDVDVDDLVHHLTGAVRAHIQAWLLAGGKGSLSEKSKTIVQIFLEGAGGRR